MIKEDEKLRIDKYLWSIRLYKTRSQAAEACEKGRVKMAGEPVKASRTVKLNDEYELRTEARKWIIRVTGLLHNRVAYPEAIQNYEDITPPEMLVAQDFHAPSFNTGKRLSKTGRPDKKQRRNMEESMGEGGGGG
jgi:ribosome-associated heat shock protein Hsp15